MLASTLRGPGALGAVLGAGAGLLLDSILIAVGGVRTIWVIGLTFGLFLIIPVAVGAKVGNAVAKTGLIGGVSHRANVLAALIVWPTCALLPIGFAFVQLRSHLSEIPVYPNASGLQTRIGLFGTDGGPPFVEISFQTLRNETTVLRFYETELTRRGWSEAGETGGSPIRFQKGAATIVVRQAQDSEDRTASFEVLYLTGADSGWIHRFLWSTF